MTVRRVDPALNERPASLPDFASYAMRTVGHEENTATEAELAMLHPRAVVDRRDAFVAGRAAAHAALTDLGRDVHAILAGAAREPLWPEGVVASISHTADLAVALAASVDDTAGVGIDIERFRPASELWDQVPRPEERRWLSDILNPTVRDRTLLALFSAKEAIYKAFYPRVGTYFGFEVAALEPSPGGFSVSLVERIAEEFPPQRTLYVHSAWVGDVVRSWLVLPRG